MSTRVDTASLIAGATVVGNRGLGILGSTILLTTGGGTDGDGVLFNDVEAGDEAKEFRAYITAPPSAGTLVMDEDGTFTFTGAAVDTATYEGFADGVSYGTATVTLYDTAAAVLAAVSGSASMLYAAVGSVSADVLPALQAVDVAIAGQASMLYAAVGSVSADLPALQAVDVAIAGQASMLYSAVGTVVASGSVILWPPASATAVVPPIGVDGMLPIAKFYQYTQDREVYNINFAARNIANGDAADRLMAIGHDPGITVTTQVAVGGLVPSGVVFFAVDDPIAPGDYKVWVQISTVAGREVTRSVIVNASTV
jgi:hypothetical protein